MTSLSCSLKGQQKLFFLQFNQAASCCRAHGIDLDPSKTVDHYEKIWQNESQELDQGIRLEGCQHCWADEDSGRLSYRQQNSGNKPHTIQLFLSNLCNHMCSYCSPKFSTVWNDSIKQAGPFTQISRTASMNLALAPQPNNIDYWLTQIENYIVKQPDNSVNLKLLGGEPLMQQRNLEKLLELNGSKIHKLIVHTNLNPPTNKFLLWILKNISNEKLVIDISLDATPNYNHVARAGFDRERFESNLVLVRQHNINYRITAVVSALSLFDLPNFIRWNQEYGHQITYTKINNPACLSVDLLPVHIKQELTKTIDQPPPIVAELLAASTESNQIQLLEQYNYLTQYFNRAKIDTDTIDNVLFQNWWSWLKGTVKQ